MCILPINQDNLIVVSVSLCAIAHGFKTTPITQDFITELVEILVGQD
ncbi:MAG: hypothetical protein AAGA80_23480 [Cyanobacteria bacterium P01_F01_bin.143]